MREDEEEHNSVSLRDSDASYGPEDRLIIPFQNENLYAYVESPGAGRKVSNPTRYQSSFGYIYRHSLTNHLDPSYRSRLDYRFG